MRPADFYELTPVEFDEAIKDKQATIKGAYKLDEQLTRWVCESVRLCLLFYRNSTRGKKQSAIRDPKKMFRLPWDSEMKKPQTYEEMKAVMKMIAAGTKNNKKVNGGKKWQHL